MVLYFKSNVVDPAAFIYVGKDKVENEELIKYGWEEDIWWFHVDKLSSAHIYLRLPIDCGYDISSIPEELLTDCAQLTKANSIEGNKKDHVMIVYTPWSNLKKDGSMAVGQVGFKDHKKVKRVMVEKRENTIINRLNKTKEERYSDLAMEREEKLKVERRKERMANEERKREEARIMEERKQMAWRKDHMYDDVFTEDAMEENFNEGRDMSYEEDFM